MNQIFCIGEMLIDFIGEKKACHLSNQQAFLMKPGGAPANVACVSSSLGGESFFIGAIGKDGFGDLLMSTLSAYGVSSQFVVRKSQPTTLAFVSLTMDGERDFVFYRGADAHLAFDDVKKISSIQNGIFHFGAATAFLEGPLKATYLDLLRALNSNHQLISFDPNYRSAFWDHDQSTFVKACEAFLRAAHLVKLSDEEAFLITGESSIEAAEMALKTEYDATFAITLGGEGALIFNREFSTRVPAPKITVVDTTGAGDAFVGALLYELSVCLKPIEALSDEDWLKDAVHRSNQVAAAVCTQLGALTAIEKKKEANHVAVD